MGKEYPLGYYYFRSKCSSAFKKQKDLTKEEDIRKALDRAKYVQKEIEALYMLRISTRIFQSCGDYGETKSIRRNLAAIPADQQQLQPKLSEGYVPFLFGNCCVDAAKANASKDKLLVEDDRNSVDTKASTSFNGSLTQSLSDKSDIETTDTSRNGISDDPLDMKKISTNMSINDNERTPAIIDINYALPSQINPALTPAKFAPEQKAAHVADLTKILKTSYKQLGLEQRDKYRQHIHDFCLFYGNIAMSESNAALKYNTELIDLVFDLIKDHKHIGVDKLFSLLVILSRNSRSKGPNKGEEPRLVHILSFLKENSLSPAAKDAIRALINYAEVNAQLISDKGGLDILLSQLSSHMQDTSFQTQVIWVLRNLTVTEPLRKVIMEKMGFLIVNSMNSHTQDATLAETSCWTLGNLALADDNSMLFAAVGAFPAAKNSIMVHNSKEQVIEAACWFFYNVTFDINTIRAVLRFGLEEPLNNILKKYQNNKNIVEWAPLILKRVRASLQLNSPQAVSDRAANKASKEGVLVVQVEGGRPQKRHVIIQPSRIAWSTTANGQEIDGELKFKEIFDILPQGDNRILIKTRFNFDKEKNYIFEVQEKSSTESWINEIKNTWKTAVAAITENHNAPAGGMQSSFTLPENVFMKDLEKTVDAVVLHEIYSDPHYVTTVFKSQRNFPNVSLWDYFAVTETKKLAKDIMSRPQDIRVPEHISQAELYDMDKIKKEASRLVEANLLKDVKQFDENPQVNAPPVHTRYEYCAKQGIRPTMEDRHVHMPYIDLMVGRNKKDDPISYYAVYDGHGGVSVADYVERHMHVNFMKHPELETDPKKALAESFMFTNNELKEHSDRLYQSNTAGSTGVVIVFKGKKLLVGWVGDSMASMFCKKRDVKLVDPHKPGDDSEKKRIEKLGGFVSEEGGVMRVNGIVAVSRAFGNFRHKVIIPEADFKEFTLQGDEEYIVLACDGLWDVMDNDSLRKFINKYLAKNGRKTQGLSEALVNEALRLGSTDNVSVIFIEFNQWKEPKRFY